MQGTQTNTLRIKATPPSGRCSRAGSAMNQIQTSSKTNVMCMRISVPAIVPSFSDHRMAFHSSQGNLPDVNVRMPLLNVNAVCRSCAQDIDRSAAFHALQTLPIHRQRLAFAVDGRQVVARLSPIE